jgi:RES domain-containing protein
VFYGGEGGAKVDLSWLNTVAPKTWQGPAWRMHSSRYSADDPGGAYRYSGRYHRGRDLFGEDEVFPALYLATAPEVTLGEKQRHLTSASLPQMRNQVLSELEVSLQAVCDIRTPEEVGISSEALMDDHDYSLPQSVSAALRNRGAEALLVPSATLLGANLVVFPDRLLDGSNLEVLDTHATRLYVERKPDESS